MKWSIAATITLHTDKSLITRQIPAFSIFAGSEEDAKGIAYAIIMSSHDMVADRHDIEDYVLLNVTPVPF